MEVEISSETLFSTLNQSPENYLTPALPCIFLIAPQMSRLFRLNLVPVR
jgi:hypothetical protein